MIPRLSAEVSYNRRWFKGAKVTDNTLRGPNDYETFTLSSSGFSAADGGGYPSRVVATEGHRPRRRAELRDVESDFARAHPVLQAFDSPLNARLRQGLLMQLGTQTAGQSRTPAGWHKCSTRSRAAVPPCGRTTRRSRPAQTAVMSIRRDHDPGTGVVHDPRMDVLVSGTVRSQPSLQLIANWQGRTR